MAKPTFIELWDGTQVPILRDDPAVLAIDKPANWLCAPEHWTRTSRNLHLELMRGAAEGEHWAKSRNLRYVRFIHRLDAETSGVLLLAKNPGALRVFSQLFEMQKVRKTYLAVTSVQPSLKARAWTCSAPLEPEPGRPGKMRVSRSGKPAVTEFKVLADHNGFALVAAFPQTGRTHQIRVHLSHSKMPVLGDELYGGASDANVPGDFPLGLRAVRLDYDDPFRRRPIVIQANAGPFAQAFGFATSDLVNLFDRKPNQG